MTARPDRRAPARRRGIVGLSVGALGIVYGDIGTSPLYAFRESLDGAGHQLAVSEQNVLGVVSLIFWSLIVVIAVKYLALVMKADNDGEGGILALTALIAHRSSAGRGRRILVLVGLFGTALLYGDGMITPAISVLGAVEGTEVATDRTEPFVVPAAALILVALFAVQRRGTAAVARVFGPVIVVWFGTLGLLGTSKIIDHPEVLEAVAPTHALEFFTTNGTEAFLAMGSVFLVVTGGEALFADMGHFGRLPITVGWYGVVLPGLLLNYFGQGALLLGDPEAIDNPFYRLAPSWGLVPLVVLATAASVIASQALISGAFSLTHQAIQLGYLPRMRVTHTSASERGQIYVPAVNWVLMVACVAMVVGFGSSTGLAAAYGVAVTLTMSITTVLFYVVARERFGWGRAPTVAVCASLLVLDLAFFGANVPKIPHGGWFPLVVAAVVLSILTTWHTGRRLVAARVRHGPGTIEDLVTELASDPPARVPGTAVYLFSVPGHTPPALRLELDLHRALAERVIVLSIETAEIPKVQPVYRLRLEEIGAGIEMGRLRLGFLDRPDVPTELRHVLDTHDVTYVLGSEAITAVVGEGMVPWRERLFRLMHRNATSPSDYFCLPPAQTVTISRHVEI